MTKRISQKDLKAVNLLETSRVDEQRPRGAQSGNENAITSGIYANQFLTQEEEDFFDTSVANFINEEKLTLQTDITQAKAAILYHMKTLRALETNNTQAAADLDRMYRSHLKGLKATRETRGEEKVTSSHKLTPAEAAVMILDNARAKDSAI